MLKNIGIRKIALTSSALLAMILMYVMPYDNSLDVSSSLEYVDNSSTSPIFLLDKNSYVALTDVSIKSSEVEDKAKEILNVLTIGQDNLPSGFTAIIPPDTVINSLEYNDGLIKVDFSSDLLDVDKDLEEKLISAIVYSLTSIDEVNKVIIYVDGEILSKLPQSNINLPSTLDRSFGINKEYEFTKADDISSVTVYYVNEVNDEYYYVPVTKYVNDDRDRISIVVDELSSSAYKDNLMSFLNSETKLVSSEVAGNTLDLEFNSYLFDDSVNKEVLEEVIYTICLSAYDNYDVDEIVLTVEGEEIYKTSGKTIEYDKNL